MANIVVLGPWDAQALLLLEQQSEHQIYHYKETYEIKSLPVNILNKTEALLIRSKTHLNSEHSKLLPELKFICSATAGFNHISNSFLSALPFAIASYCPDAQTQSVTELTLGFIFSQLRGFTENPYTGKRPAHRDLELSETTIGIMGFGRIGQSVVHALKAISHKTHFLIYDPYVNIESSENVRITSRWEDMLNDADILSLHVPLTQKTHHFFDDSKFEYMKPSACLINTSRGAVVNNHDLAKHLDKKPEFKAFLDVTDPEPLPNGHPLLKIYKKSNPKQLFLTPHIGAYTQKAFYDSCISASQKCLFYFKNKKFEPKKNKDLPELSPTLPCRAPWCDD